LIELFDGQIQFGVFFAVRLVECVAGRVQKFIGQRIA
jgi:hypothetical protein